MRKLERMIAGVDFDGMGDREAVEMFRKVAGVVAGAGGEGPR